MKPSAALIGPHLQAFFTDYLLHQKRASPHTVASCRDTFRLLLTFVRDTLGIEPSAVRIPDLEVTLILRFLESLERQRGNAIRSRNIRLSAIRSFFRVVALRDPTSVELSTRILAIPVKREDKRLIGYLTREEVAALLAVPDRSGWSGRRNHALLLTLYNTGARVSEVIGLRCTHVQFGPTTLMHFRGKGRKHRSVPLWPHTARTLHAWVREVGAQPEQVLFPNARGGPLSRDGVDYLLQQAVSKAVVTCPSLGRKHISPHVLRHSTAMHLLQAGVDIAVIALWLGHESIETTHMYLESDVATKERALQKLTPIEGPLGRFKAPDPLLRFLTSL